MHHPHRLALGALNTLVLAALAAALQPVRAADRFEAPPVLSAAKVLPPQLAHGPNFTVAPRVENDGLLNHYRLETPYGAYEVTGTELLKLRAEEMAALGAMEKLDVPSEFLKSASTAATAPLRGAARLLTQPGKAVSETAQGIGRVFGRVGDAITPSTDDNPDGPFAAITGFSAAKRKIAVDFGVDPYTRFLPLQQRLVVLARASTAGSLTVRGALMVVPGGVGIGIGVSSGIENAGQLLREKTPDELNDINRATLRGMGVGEPTIDRFLATPILSPADKTIIVESLRQLGSAHAQGIYIDHAARVPDAATAYFVRHRAEMIATYNRRVEPVTGFIAAGDVPVMQTRSGKVVALLPFDYIAWTRQTASLFDVITGDVRRGRQKIPLELWITGQASGLSAASLKRRGWHLRQNVQL